MGSFTTLCDAIVDDLLELHPEEATALGDHRFDDRTEDRSQAGVDRAIRRLRSRQEELLQVSQEELDPEARVDYEVLANRLQLQLLQDEELRAPSWNPLAYNPGDSLFYLISQTTQPLEARLRGICGRLEAVPELVDLARQQLANPPAIHVETALRQHPGVVELIRDEASRLAQGSSDIQLRGRLARAQSRALAAWEEMGRFLEEIQPSAQGSFRLGPELFSRKLQLELHSPLGPDEVLRRAERRVEELRRELEEVCGQLSGGGERGDQMVRRVLGEIAETRPDDATVLGAAETALGELREVVEGSGLFTMPDDPLDVEEVPRFMRGTASAYCVPAGPFEEGGRTKIMIAPTPETWTEEQVESFYREINSAMMVMLMAHEGIPGHFLQLARARRFRGPSKVRSAFYNGPFVEGWACHAERIVVELGHGGPRVRTQQIKVQIRTAMNAILDSSVHARGLEEQEAVELMVGRGYQERSEAESKWRRACLTSAQLSTYFVGYTELQDLFDGSGPALPYDEVLAHGSPPSSLLKGLLSQGRTLGLA